MEKQMEQKMLSTMELLAEKVIEISNGTEQIKVVLEQVAVRLDKVEARLDKLEVRIDEVETKLSARIDEMETKLSARIDEVETTLRAHVDEVEMVLRTEMKTVYDIACENREKIETLLFPYQNKAVSVVNEVAKISEMKETQDMIIETVGRHSEAIRNIQNYLHINKKTGKKKLFMFNKYKFD